MSSLNVQTKFNLEDLRRGYQLSKHFLKIPIVEQRLSFQETVVKYQELTKLKQLLEHFDQRVLAESKIDFEAPLNAFPETLMGEEEQEREVENQEEEKNQMMMGEREMYEAEEEDPGLKQIFQKNKNVSNQDYIKMFIDYVVDIFNKERGKDDTKKANLADIKSTQIDPCHILRLPLIPSSQKVDRFRGVIEGNVKALVPIQRERLTLEWDSNQKAKYKKSQPFQLLEKRIFGIVTPRQLGYIPSLEVFKTEDEEHFICDTYMFKSLSSMLDGVEFDLESERYRVNVVNTYSKDSIQEDSVDQPIKVSSLNQLELFHKFVISDLFRSEKPLSFEPVESKDKKYYIVPLILDKSCKGKVRYEVDRKLLAKIEQIEQIGYHRCFSNIYDLMKAKGLFQTQAQIEYLQKQILVKYDKPHSCYNFFQMIDNLREMSAESFATAIKGKPEDLGCQTAFDLVYNVHTRFKSINSFRESVFANREKEKIQEMPLMLLDPIKVISHLKFKYALEQCPKNPDKKNAYRKNYKEKNNLTTSQGKPIFSSFHIHKHYMNKTYWDRGSQLPIVLSFIERHLFCHQLIAQINSYLHPELVLWATSAQGISASKKSYETLETYGDTILKLASTFLAYDNLKDDEKADENTINAFKSAFITNLYLYRIGSRLGLRQYMRTVDPDPKAWNPPFYKFQSNTEHVNCTGKNIADCVESLIGAFFISNNLRRTLKFISDIKLVPLKEAGLLEGVPDRDLTFEMKDDLDEYGFSIDDSVEDIYNKYFICQSVPSYEKNRILSIIDSVMEVPDLSSAYNNLFESTDLSLLSSADLHSSLLQVCLVPVQRILNYEFKEPMLLLEALTHQQFKKAVGMQKCYEKLEILGDAILDYIANSNLIKYTIFEKYNIAERLSREYITQEDFLPFDAHQAKSFLTKNDFLAKLVCLFGLQQFILFQRPKGRRKDEEEEKLYQALSSDSEHEVARLQEELGPMAGWKLKKILKQLEVEREANKFIRVSFRKAFSMNKQEVEIFQAPKILGDVFESIMGAVYVDGGFEEVLRVYQHLLAPLALFVAKFSKKLSKEPKEDFILSANLLKIKPEFKAYDAEMVSLAGLVGSQSPVTGKLPSQQTIIKDQAKLIKVEIKFNNNSVMASGYGNTRKQAERNASIEGLKFLQTLSTQHMMDWE